MSGGTTSRVRKHGFRTIFNENGTEAPFITDTVKHQVYEATIDGKILMTIDVLPETESTKKPRNLQC